MWGKVKVYMFNLPINDERTLGAFLSNQSFVNVVCPLLNVVCCLLNVVCCLLNVVCRLLNAAKVETNTSFNHRVY